MDTSTTQLEIDMKYKVTTLDNSQCKEFRATSYLEFANFVQSCIAHGANNYLYFIDNNQLSASEALEFADNEYNKWYENKLKTHKQISISNGATKLQNTYQKIWVKK